jgi:hypothetical protein
MNAFYFFGTLDFQDSIAVLLESLKRQEDTWVCFFDSNKRKRQLYYYEKVELEDYIKKICKLNKLKIPIVDFFGQNDEIKFKNKFKSIEPTLIFCQFIYHKFPNWTPFVGSSKIIHLGWGVKEAQVNLKKSSYKENITLNVSTRERYLLKENLPKNFKFFGDLPRSQLYFTPFSFKQFANNKVCFIPETWFFAGTKTWGKEQAKVIDEIFKFLKQKDFKVVLKKREKGYPDDRVLGFNNYLNQEPDFFIKKDFLFPTSMISLPIHSNICMILGSSGASEIAQINKNTFSSSLNDNIVKEAQQYINEKNNTEKPPKEEIYKNKDRNAASELLNHIDNKIK